MPSKRIKGRATSAEGPKREVGNVAGKSAVSGRFVKDRDCGEVRQAVKASVKRSATKECCRMGEALQVLTAAEIIEINRELTTRFDSRYVEEVDNLHNPDSLFYVLEAIQSSVLV